MDTVFVSGTPIGDALEVLSESFEVVQDEGGVASDAFAACADRVRAIVALITDRIDEQVLAKTPRLAVVANVAVGYDNIDVPACAARSVIVTNTPGVLTDATADVAVALILMTTRRPGEAERLVRAGGTWSWSMFFHLGTGIQGKTLGIVGLGQIGRATARRARAFGMEIAY